MTHRHSTTTTVSAWPLVPIMCKTSVSAGYDDFTSLNFAMFVDVCSWIWLLGIVAVIVVRERECGRGGANTCEAAQAASTQAHS